MKTPKVIKVKKVVEAPVEQPEYVITVTIEHGTYIGRGKTALEALKDVPMPELISAGTLRIEYNGKSKEMLYPTMQLKRIFNIYHQETLINDIVWGMS